MIYLCLNFSELILLYNLCWTMCFDVFKSKWNAWRPLLLVVCVSRVFEFVNSLFVMIQGCLISILLKKICFLKEVKNQPVEISIQPVVLHLVYFEKDLKKLDCVWLCCQTNSIDWFVFSTDGFSENINRILLSGFNML